MTTTTLDDELCEVIQTVYDTALTFTELAHHSSNPERVAQCFELGFIEVRPVDNFSIVATTLSGRRFHQIVANEKFDSEGKATI